MRNSNQLNNNKSLKTKRQYLRTPSTPAEILLWKFLKQNQLVGRKFRRQHSIGNYILDFYCPSQKLIIELDGNAHLNPTIGKHNEKELYFYNLQV